MSAYKLRAIAAVARKKVLKIGRREGFDYDLCGLCGRGSAILFNELAERGFRPSIVHGATKECDHFYVKCNGYIIDITCQQFNWLLPCDYSFPKIMIVKEHNKKMLMVGIWNEVNKFYSIEEARISQLEEDWPNKQIIRWSDIG